MSVTPAAAAPFPGAVDVVIVGAGLASLTAAREIVARFPS